MNNSKNTFKTEEEKKLEIIKKRMEVQKKIDEINQNNIQNALNSKKKKGKKILCETPKMISLNNVREKGLSIPILEKDLLSRLNFYADILSGFEINLTKNFSGKIDLSEILKELSFQIYKNRFKIIQRSKK